MLALVLRASSAVFRHSSSTTRLAKFCRHHVLTQELTVLGSLTWDRGTSRRSDGGVLGAGDATRSLWRIAGPSLPIFELSGGMRCSLIKADSNARGERWGTGNVLAFSPSAKASF